MKLEWQFVVVFFNTMEVFVDVDSMWLKTNFNSMNYDAFHFSDWADVSESSLMSFNAVAALFVDDPVMFTFNFQEKG